MQMRREPAPLLFSIAIHVAVAFAILNAAFHYDFSGLTAPRPATPASEKLTYVNVAPSGGAAGGRDSTGPAPRTPPASRGLVAQCAFRTPSRRRLVPPPARRAASWAGAGEAAR